MISAKIHTLTVPANGAAQLTAVGKFFKLLSTTGAVDVVGEGFRLEGVGTGQGLQNVNFKRLELVDRTGSANTVSVILGDAEFIDSLNGVVSVTQNAPITVSTPAVTESTVTNAAAQLVAANASRKFIAIQNNDAAGSIRIKFGATMPGASAGILIGPGGYWEMPPGTACTAAVNAIGSVASNPNIEVLTG